MPPDLSQPISSIKYYRPHGPNNNSYQLCLLTYPSLSLLLNTIGLTVLLPCYPRTTNYPSIMAHVWCCPSYRGNPLDAQAQEPQAGRNAQAHVHDHLMFCYHIGFWVLPFLLSDIPGPRPISREDAHPMYPWYLRVFLFCHDLLPTPPPISVRKTGVITVVYLCGF